MFITHLHNLFKLSLFKLGFTWILEKSFISPIYKSGSKNNVRNYRAIFKLSISPKVFEAIISERISNLPSKSINLSKHGFLPRYSNQIY